MTREAGTPYTQRKIIHIDMDAFYASVEQRDNPEYRGKPIVVGGLPATGKSTVASTLARQAGFAFVRVDRIEQAIIGSAGLRQPATCRSQFDCPMGRSSARRRCHASRGAGRRSDACSTSVIQEHSMLCSSLCLRAARLVVRQLTSCLLPVAMLYPSLVHGQRTVRP